MKTAIVSGKPDEVNKYLADIDPLTWVSYISPRPVLFVNGTKDTIVPKAAADALISAAKEPKTVYWDDVGHTIAPLRFTTVLQWLLKNTPAKS